jgi:hypothetical protein
MRTVGMNSTRPSGSDPRHISGPGAERSNLSQAAVRIRQSIRHDALWRVGAQPLEGEQLRLDEQPDASEVER